MRRTARILLCIALVGLVAAPALGQTTSGWASWDPLTGTSNNFTSAMQLPAGGFPEATVVSDSRSGSVGVQSGSSVWLGINTPVGLEYGSSQDQPYLNLRPKADNATSPSRTTYTFDSPTPPTGWAFVLGDIDADSVRVTAKDADGTDVPSGQLGFAGSFNLCDTTPRPGGCSASVGDVPTWNPGTQTLTGNPTASDTFGAAGWFQPTVSLSSLTFEFTRRSGFPVYQTWFASLARTISGTVDDVSAAGTCPVTGVTVVLTGPDGSILDTAQPDAAGAYSFGQYATQPGYSVSIEPPSTCAVVGPQSQSVSTSTDDAIANFEVRAIIPQPVSGSVTADGQPVPGVPVTLHLPGGGTTTTTTDSQGNYLFDDNAAGTGYFVTIDVPDGYTGDDTRPPFDIVATPITDEDFVLTANPDLSGQVTGGGAGLGGVTITLTPTGGGAALTVVTGGDGGYTFEKIPPGTYDIAVEEPPGYDDEPPLLGIVVGPGGLTGQDFALSRPGSIGGTVHLESADGPGQPDVPVEIEGPGGSQTSATDGEGNYFVDDLPAGTYEIAVVVPDGFDPVGPLVRPVTITDAGEVVGGQDFVIEQTAAPTTPTPTPSPTPAAPGGDDDGGGTTLPATGSDVRILSLFGGVLLIAGGAVMAATHRDRMLNRQ